MSIEITGLEEVQAQLTNLSRSLTPSAMGRKMHTIGNKVSNVIEDAFEDERSPFGQSWQPRKRTRRGQSTKVLQFKYNKCIGSSDIKKASYGLAIIRHHISLLL